MATRVCAKGELAPGMMVRVDVDGTPVMVCNAEGEIHAIADTCSHEESSLSEGFLDDHVVECAKHGAQFDVRTGKNLSLPATKPVPAYRVRVEGDDIYVEAESA